MNNKLFREKSIDRINSPEAMRDYMQVATPSVWMMIIGIAVLLLGGIAWSILGKVETRVPAVIVVKGGEAACYYEESGNYKITPGMKVEANGEYYNINVVSDVPQVVDEDNAYIATMLNKSGGILIFEADTSTNLPDGVYRGSIITEEIAPIRFLTN